VPESARSQVGKGIRRIDGNPGSAARVLPGQWHSRLARVSDPAKTADRRSPGNRETCGRPGGSVGDSRGHVSPRRGSRSRRDRPARRPAGEPRGHHGGRGPQRRPASESLSPARDETPPSRLPHGLAHDPARETWCERLVMSARPRFVRNETPTGQPWPWFPAAKTHSATSDAEAPPPVAPHAAQWSLVVVTAK
jgi:hypothetical protein